MVSDPTAPDTASKRTEDVKREDGKMPILKGRCGLGCPRCNNGGLFNYPKDYGKNYGLDKFYCESCDPLHQHPIKKKDLEERSILDTPKK